MNPWVQSENGCLFFKGNDPIGDTPIFDFHDHGRKCKWKHVAPRGGGEVQAVVWNLEMWNFGSPNKWGGSQRKVHVFSVFFFDGLHQMPGALGSMCTINLLVVSCLVFFVSYATKVCSYYAYHLQYKAKCNHMCRSKLLQVFILWPCFRMGRAHFATDKLQFTCVYRFMARSFSCPFFPDCIGCSGKQLCRMFWVSSST